MVCMQKVAQLLREMPVTRDDDSKLLSLYWAWEGDKKGECFDFLSALHSGVYTPAESITRARRKLQELDPDLRGTKYEKRHLHSYHVARQMTLFDLEHCKLSSSPNL